MGKLKETKQVIKESLKDVFESKEGYSFEIKLNDTYTMVVSAYSLTNRDLTESVKKFDKELLEDNIKVDVFDELDLVYHLDNIDLKTLKESLVSKVCHDLGIKKTKTEKLTEGKEKKSTKARFVGNPQKEMSAFNHFMGEGVDEDKHYGFEGNENLQPYFDIELEDDETSYGGTSYAHETLYDFLCSVSDVFELDRNTTLEEVNNALKECGIKPIIPEDGALTGDEEGIDSIPQLRDLSRKQLAELAYKLFNVSNISFVPEDDAIVDLEYYIIDHKDDEEAMDKVLYFAHEVSGLEEGRARKWIEVEVLQGNYGQGWEDLVEYEIPADWEEAKKVYKEVKDDVKAYRENEPQYAHRVVTRKKPINNTSKEEKSNTDENKGLKEDATIKINKDKPKKEIEYGWELVKVDANGKETVVNKGSEEEINNLKSTTKDTPNEKFIVRKSEKVVEDYLDDRNKLAEINLKDWYTSEFPTDELGKELNDGLTLKDIYTFLGVYGGKGNDEHGDFYDYIGVGDSVVRERIFKKLAKELGKDYKDIYNLWLKVEESCKKKDNEIKIKSGKKVAIEKPDTSKAGEEGNPIQKGLKGRTGKLEGLNEDIDEFDADFDVCAEDVADTLDSGWWHGQTRSGRNWGLIVNGGDGNQFSPYFADAVAYECSYPVRDGYFNFSGLDCIPNKSTFAYMDWEDEDKKETLKNDLLSVGCDEEEIEKFFNDEIDEIEFYIDYEIDIDDYEDDYDESLKEDTVKTSKGKWTNKGKEGTHGTFKTKKQADAQRKAMFANKKKGSTFGEGMKDRLDAYVKSQNKEEIKESDELKVYEVNFEKKNDNPPFEYMNASRYVKATSEEEAIEKIIKKLGIERDKVNGAYEVELEEKLTEANEGTTTFYSLELGVLLPEDDAEYDDYAVAFDKKHAYFDETHLESLDEQELINDATEYINSGVPRTYGIVSKIEVENFDGIEDVIAEMKENGFIEESVDFFDGEQYKAENVVWSGMKDDDETIKLDFVEIPGKEKEDEVEIEKETKTEVEEEPLKEASNSMKDKVERTTVNYTKEKGAIMCNKGQQAEEVEALLKAHYNNVEVVPVKHSVQIKYSGKKVNEAIEDKTADELAYERYKNGEYTYDEYVTVCDTEGCEPLPEIKAEEKPEEDKWTNDFIELLDLIEFDLEKHDDADEDEKWSLIDKQGANLGNIESDRFGDASGILDRLNIYIEDYIIDDLDRILNGLDDVSTEGLNTWEDYLNWYNTIGKEKYAEEFSAWDFEVLDLLINHAEDVDIEKAYKIINGELKESLKEWFNGKQLDELIALCDKLGIKGFKEIQKIKNENNFSEEEVLDYLRKKAEGDK